MSFLTRFFNKSKEKKAEVRISEVSVKKHASTGTVLRQPKEATPLTAKKKGPELTALEIAEQKGWEVKSLPLWEPGDTILDTYEVEDIFSGGMGHVYIANHNKWHVKLAIKSPNEMMLSQKEHFARILREANAWIEMGMHPNVAYCYYVRNIEDVPHIVVEYVDGGNLKEWIEDGKCIDYRTNLDLAIQFCHGMEFAHSKGMIHRDIKPANILMTKDGILKITDFGLVREQRPEAGNQTSEIRSQKGGRKLVDGNLTTIGTQMGTAGYMSPEQHTNPHDVDERTDIFAFGVCLYEMFCGNRPYEITFGEKQELPDPMTLSGDEKFPLKLAEVLKRSVQWDVSDRYRSFEEIRQELSRIHKKLYKEDSPYAKLEIVDLEADGLNNMGVSYCELGRKEDAIKSWKEAIKINSTHPEAIYNLSLIEWRDGKIDDMEVLRRLENCKNNPANKGTIEELIACIHTERYDPESARKVLVEFLGRYDELFSGKEPSQIRCLRTMEGHTDNVSSVAISNDGRFALSGSMDKTLRLWELSMGECLRIMEGHTDWVNSCAITPDGRFGLSGSGGGLLAGMEKDKTIRFWNLETGKCLRIMEGHTDWVDSCAITPDGRFALSGSDDTLRLWELSMGECLRIMEGHTDRVNSIAFSSDGRFALSGSWDKTLNLWEIKTGRCVRTMEGHTDKVNSIAFSPDGKFALSGSKDHTLKLWEIETGRCIRTIIKVHSFSVNSVAFSSNGRFALSGSDDKTIKLWEMPSQIVYKAPFALSLPKDIKTIIDEKDILKEKISYINNLMAKGSYIEAFSAFLRTWQETSFKKDNALLSLYFQMMRKGKAKGVSIVSASQKLEGHTDIVYSVAFNPDSRLALSGSKDRTLRLWEIETGKCIKVMEGHTDSIRSVAFSPDGRFALSGSWDKTLKFWEIETGRCIRTMERHTDVLSSVTFSPDGKYALSGSSDKTLRLWEVKTGKCIQTIGEYISPIFSVAFSPDGRFALSGGHDKILRLWEIETGRCLRTMEGHTDFIISVAFSPDGRFALSGSNDRTISLWEIDTGEEIKIMEVYLAPIYSITFSSDGRFVLSGGGDRSIRLWEIETGKCIKDMDEHTNFVYSVVFSPDGRLALSGSEDKNIILWEFIWDLDFAEGYTLSILDK